MLSTFRWYLNFICNFANYFLNYDFMTWKGPTSNFIFKRAKWLSKIHFPSKFDLLMGNINLNFIRTIVQMTMSNFNPNPNFNRAKIYNACSNGSLASHCSSCNQYRTWLSWEFKVPRNNCLEYSRLEFLLWCICASADLSWVGSSKAVNSNLQEFFCSTQDNMNYINRPWKLVKLLQIIQILVMQAWILCCPHMHNVRQNTVHLSGNSSAVAPTCLAMQKGTKVM